MSAFVIIKDSLFCLVIECTSISAQSQETKSYHRSMEYKSDMLHGSFPRCPNHPPFSHTRWTGDIVHSHMRVLWLYQVWAHYCGFGMAVSLLQSMSVPNLLASSSDAL